MKKALIFGVFGLILLSLFANLGYSAITITSDKGSYTCNFNVCEPIKVTITNTQAGTYTFAVKYTTKTGTITNVKMPYATTKLLNKVTTTGVSVPASTFSFNINMSALGSGKFNITAYNASGAVVATLDPWWSNNFSYSRPFNVTEQDGVYLSNLTINFSIDTATLISAGKMQNDCGDIRILDKDNNRVKQRIENCNTANTIIYIGRINLPATTTNNYTMFYGDPTAPNLNDAWRDVYIWADKFLEPALNSSCWFSASSGTLNTSENYLQKNAGQWNSLNPNCSVETNPASAYPQRVIDDAKNYTIEFNLIYRAGSTTDWQFEDKEIGTNTNMGSGGNAFAIECYSALAPTECALVKADGAWTQNTSKLSATWTRVKIDIITPDREQIVLTNITGFVNSMSWAITALDRNFFFRRDSAGADQGLTNFTINRYTRNMPLVLIGNEESAPPINYINIGQIAPRKPL